MINNSIRKTNQINNDILEKFNTENTRLSQRSFCVRTEKEKKKRSILKTKDHYLFRPSSHTVVCSSLIAEKSQSVSR